MGNNITCPLSQPLHALGCFWVNWWMQGADQDAEMSEWVIARATEFCSKEFSQLSHCGAHGPCPKDAQFMHLKAADITAQCLQEFTYEDLAAQYDCTTPLFQHFLKGVINKEGAIQGEGERNPLHVRV